MITPRDWIGRAKELKKDGMSLRHAVQYAKSEAEPAEYLEYVWQDHNHYYVAELPEAVAREWLRGFNLTPYQSGGYGEEQFLMNKGAVKVYDGDFNKTELWVYKHDFKYWLTSPKKET